MTSKRLNIQWAAGLYEGEGSCYLAGSNSKAKHQYRYPELQVGSTDRDVLVEFQRIVKGGSINGPYNTVHKDGLERKDMYQWRVRGTEAVRIAKRLRPYVNGRRGAKIDQVLTAKHGRQ